MKAFLGKLFFDDSLTYRFVRAASVAGFATAIIGVVDRFFPDLVPSGAVGLTLFLLSVCCGILALELMNAHKDLRNSRVRTTGNARADFAASVAAYASSLATSTPPRDQALLELRRWSSRLLHLNGSHTERAEIGRLALGAAGALQDHFTQAAILIDDLGWGLYMQGQTNEAASGIKEGVAILESLSAVEQSRPEVIELLIKARRHLVTIEFASDNDIKRALGRVAELALAAGALPDPTRALHAAQLSHTEAALIHQYIDSQVGTEGKVDPTGTLFELYQKGIESSRVAETRFGELADVERQLKALKMYVELLRHGPQSSRLHTAESRLKRLETVASRQLK